MFVVFIELFFIRKDNFFSREIRSHTDLTNLTESCIASLAAVGFAECLRSTIREYNDANFVRFARGKTLSIIIILCNL